MSLPWFAFNIKAYLSDTMRLTTEAHGSYLLLMLDYYESEGPAPDDDDVLAAIAKLPVEQWKKHRKVLERYFEIREGHWYHNRIETEMREASAKHAAGIAAAKAGAAARWAKEGAKPATKPKERRQNTAKAQNDAVAMPTALLQAMPEAMLPDCTSTLTPPYNKGGEEAPRPEADLEIEVGLIPKDFTPDPATSDRAKATGMTVAEIDAEVRKFILKRQGQLSDDWQGSFALWMEREITFRAKQAAKAPPRIEVNSNSSSRIASVKATPTDAEFDRQVAMLAKGMPWSSQLGPEPGHAGCRVPERILTKHGIDPKTGFKVRAAS